MTEQQVQAAAPLAVHVSQLTRDNMATLVREGYSILPDQSGWIVMVKTAPSEGTAPNGRTVMPEASVEERAAGA